MGQVLTALGLSALAGASTGIGSLAAFFVKKFDKKTLSFLLGFSAGVMIMVSFVELFATAISSVGFLLANIGFFAGVGAMFLVDSLIPHNYEFEKSAEKKLMRTGVLTSVGIAIHNFPEGLVVLAAGLKSAELGVLLAVAIAIHNIPEGIAVSVPIFYATKSRKKALWYSFLSGIAEPFGALVGAALLVPFIGSPTIDVLLAFVAGIMVFISIDELIPTAYGTLEMENGRGHAVILGIVLGMAVMSFSLLLLKYV